jgi:hypothetical protein
VTGTIDRFTHRLLYVAASTRTCCRTFHEPNENTGRSYLSRFIYIICVLNRGRQYSMYIHYAILVMFIRLIICLFQLVFLAETVFFSHNKSANSVFQPAYQHSPTEPLFFETCSMRCDHNCRSTNATPPRHESISWFSEPVPWMSPCIVDPPMRQGS